MTRVEKLNEATNRMVDGAEAGDSAFYAAMLVLGCILHDVALNENRVLRGYQIYAEILRERDEALHRGDIDTVEAIKADVRAALEYMVRTAASKLPPQTGNDDFLD